MQQNRTYSTLTGAVLSVFVSTLTWSCSENLSSPAAKEPSVGLKAEDLKGRWNGSFRQFSHDVNETYPMLMEINSVQGNEFSGVIVWPDCATKIKGECDGTRVWWTELGFVKGDNAVLYGIYKTDQKSDQVLAGDWLDPKPGVFHDKAGEFQGTSGGTFKLRHDRFKQSIDAELNKLNAPPVP